MEPINIYSYTEDIKKQIESDFGENSHQAIQEIQELIISDETFRNERIIRAIIHLANKDLEQLRRTIQNVKIDYRDILVQAEYENESNAVYPEYPKRIRDFSNEFGKESI